MKHLFVLPILFLFTTSITFANESAETWRMNHDFYECLKTCTDYHSSMSVVYNKENNTAYFDRYIKKNGRFCQVVFSNSALSTNPPADAGGTADVYQFPMKILKEINDNNFDEYAKKYYDEEHSL